MKTGQSFIGITVDTSQVDSVKRDIINAMGPEVRKNALAVGAESALISIKGYYTSSGRNNWINTSLPTHGAGRKLTEWWKLVESGWNVGRITPKTATIFNGTIGLSQKVTGGTITAKRKKFLTVPVHPTAHGVRARDYSASIAPLFIAKGVLARKEDDKSITPIYALRKSVNQKPWPTALPPEETYTEAFINGAAQYILDSI
jgi:hypothetical protein